MYVMFLFLFNVPCKYILLVHRAFKQLMGSLSTGVAKAIFTVSKVFPRDESGRCI